MGFLTAVGFAMIVWDILRGIMRMSSGGSIRNGAVMIWCVFCLGFSTSFLLL